MEYCDFYSSPIGKLLIKVNGSKVVSLGFCDDQNLLNLKNVQQNEDSLIIRKVKRWLNCYFEGKNPAIDFEIEMICTEFQKEVYDIISKIPYGKVMTYKDVGDAIAKNRGIKKMSYRAVGGALSKNKIIIIIPCHRVIASNNKIGGFSCGLDKKEFLLSLENNHKHQ